MAKDSLDVKFSKYWAQLTPVQKQALLRIINTFIGEEGRVNVELSDQELNEAEAAYNVPWEIWPLSKQQKKALIAFLQSSGIEPAGRISIEQYNKEIDEAMEEYERGEFYTQEEVEEMSKKW